MFWMAQSTMEETFNAYADVKLDGRRTPELKYENEKALRKESITETSRPQISKTKTAPSATAKPRTTHSFSVGKSDGVKK